MLFAERTDDLVARYNKKKILKTLHPGQGFPPQPYLTFKFKNIGIHILISAKYVIVD
jgi:hypothetical protein